MPSNKTPTRLYVTKPGKIARNVARATKAVRAIDWTARDDNAPRKASRSLAYAVALLLACAALATPHDALARGAARHAGGNHGHKAGAASPSTARGLASVAFGGVR